MLPLYWVFFALLLSPSLAFAQRPPAVVPAGADTVLERLPPGYAALAPALRAARTSMADVDRLLSLAARTGDARLATRADGLLARFPTATRDTSVIRARAYSAQHRHEFAAALRLLDRALLIEPRDADARLARAQIHLVQGRIDRARGDCAALVLGIDAGHGLICVASLSSRIGDTATSMTLLDRWLKRTGQAPDVRRTVLVMRAEAAAQAEDEDADDWFRRALVISPQDVRTLAAYSRHLLATGRPREVLVRLVGAPSSDGLQLQRALAARAAKTPDAGPLTLAQKRRYALAHAVGSEPELRDAAEFMLSLEGDASGALQMALRNFTSQRDREDVEILRRAAHAAGRPDALAPLQAWAKAQGLPLPPLPGTQR